MRNGLSNFMALPILTIGAFIDIWLRPRAAAGNLFEKKSPFTHFKILAALAFAIFCQILTFLWIGNLLPSIDTSLNGSAMALACLLYVFIFAGISVALNLGSLAFYYSIRSLGGTASFAQTKSVVYWSSLGIIPVGLCFLSFIWSGLIGAQAAEKGVHDFLFTDAVQLLSALGMLFFAVYGMVILTKMLSEIHQINTGRAFAGISGGFIATSILSPLIFLAAIKVV